MMDRRTFLGTMTAAALLSRKMSFAADDHKISSVGVQVYTVRDQMKQDFAGTLAKVAQIGYKEIEFAGYFGHSPKEVRKILDQNGLTSPSSHVDYKLLGDQWAQTLDAAKIIGQPYICCPWIPDEIRNQPDGWKQAADTFNRAGEASKKMGIQFAYHNHNFEFARTNGTVPYDLLLRETDPSLVKMEMDLCWISVGGGDPVAYFDRYPGRFPMVHVKDIKKLPPAGQAQWVDPNSLGDQLTDVGNGVIDWKRIFAAGEKGGIKHYFVEQDYPKDPLASLKNSFTYLQNLRF
ncbi:MAG TPA: sugar phosphate isomerase/epimerase [Terriglobales bacterium]|nr:sugar phosphate isomerase/epimerase [Terriglobales bacterium]